MTSRSAAPSQLPGHASDTPLEIPSGSEDAFFDWAAENRVGSLDLPVMVRSRPPQEVVDIAVAYCARLSEAPEGAGTVVISGIRNDTGASHQKASEFLAQVVAAYCPNKARHLL